MRLSQLRFVHAADFHLDQPLSGVAEVPRHLESVFLDAKFQAAERVFDVVLSEQADALLLSGDILNVRQGNARAAEFLWQQFRRLHERSIAVFWLDSGRDAIERWPIAVPLPANVRVFAGEHVERITLRRGDQRPLMIYGKAGASTNPLAWEDFRHTGDAYAIAMLRADQAIDVQRLDPSIHYWALGGEHQRRELTVRGFLAAYCGAPQGNGPDEVGPHGCLLVDVDHRGTTHRHFVATDVVRWVVESVELPKQADANGLLRMLRERARKLLDQSEGQQVLVRWHVVDGDQTTDTPSDLLTARLRQGELAGEMLQVLRDEFNASVPGVWSISLEAVAPELLPAGWYEEDTVLGDLLRLVQHLQTNPDVELALESLPRQHEFGEQMAQRLQRVLQDEREALLRRVAVLGVDILRGDRVLSEE